VRRAGVNLIQRLSRAAISLATSMAMVLNSPAARPFPISSSACSRTPGFPLRNTRTAWGESKRSLEVFKSTGTS